MKRPTLPKLRRKSSKPSHRAATIKPTKTLEETVRELNKLRTHVPTS
jgi:hypothetical protein